MKAIDIILVIVSVILILLIVIQESKEDSMSAFSGEKSDLFANKKLRGSDKVIAWVTGITCVLFLLLCIAASFWTSRF